MAERNKLVSRWRALFRKGSDFDSWGQLVEAIEEYQMLSRQLMKETIARSTLFTDGQKQILQKIAACLELRAKTLQNPQAAEGISLEELRKLDLAFGDVLSNRPSEFPVIMPVNAVLHRPSAQHGNFEIDIEGDEIEEEDGSDEEEEADSGESKQLKGFKPAGGSIKPEGTLLPRIPLEPGTTNISIRIEKIGLKDSFTYLDPFIVISVKDKTGMDVTRSQDTPVSTQREDPYILFGTDVEIQRPMEKLPSGTAIFFELKHYKLKKRTISTKCFAFLEMDEIRPGPVVIELYQKPTDFRRKKLNLLTNKSLYLHLYLLLHTS